MLEFTYFFTYYFAMQKSQKIKPYLKSMNSCKKLKVHFLSRIIHFFTKFRIVYKFIVKYYKSLIMNSNLCSLFFIYFLFDKLINKMIRWRSELMLHYEFHEFILLCFFFCEWIYLQILGVWYNFRTTVVMVKRTAEVKNRNWSKIK